MRGWDEKVGSVHLNAGFVCSLLGRINIMNHHPNSKQYREPTSGAPANKSLLAGTAPAKQS